jgi:D-alanyl-lipoteichoic acid acyltransferase DltB (MBOAT superfamily)
MPLIIFKYADFILSQITSLSLFFHVEYLIASPPPRIIGRIVNLTLPIGISFYTFQAAGYLIDIWRKEQSAEKNIIYYALFLSFFPQLVAGPIERSKHLLGQLKKDTVLSYENISYGLRLMGLGLFLKVFVADTLGYCVDPVYGHITAASGLGIEMATIFFGIQIYCDFNGYSLIARGCAKALNIDLVKNFNDPYLSKSISEFWRRWHISLSFWFRDYVYIPLGGSRCSKLKHYRNLLITFLLSGIWHGADWTFVIWGGLNGTYIIIEEMTGLNKRNIISKRTSWLRWLYTYCLINIAWIFFRANSLHDIKIIFKKLINIPRELIGILNHTGSFVILGGIGNFLYGSVGIMSILCLSLYEKKNKDICMDIAKQPLIIRWLGYVLMLVVALCFGSFGNTSSQFVYFRF